MVITDVRDAESSPALVLAGPLKAEAAGAAEAAICKIQTCQIGLFVL